MFEALANSVVQQRDDSPEFIAAVRALAVGVARGYAPQRLYIVRIDNWFGPRWLHFSGKFLGVAGVHKKKRLTVPPFVPSRVLKEDLFDGPSYQRAEQHQPLHIDCKSELALLRYIDTLDRDAAFVWFSGDSALQKRGAVMVYPPVSSEHASFYAGFAARGDGMEIAMLRGVSRTEVEHLRAQGALDPALNYA